MKPFKFLRTSPCPIRCYGGEKGVPQIISPPGLNINLYYTVLNDNGMFEDIFYEPCVIEIIAAPSWEEFLYDNRENYIFIYEIRNYYEGDIYGLTEDFSLIPRYTPLTIYAIIKSEYDNEN